jgi:nucleoid DNA-binding protein
MNKDELIWEVANRCGYTFKDTELFFNTLIDIFRDAIKNHVKIAVRGFGQLNYVGIAAHRGKKPTKGVKGVAVEIDIPATEYVAFKLSSDLRNALKADQEENI